MLIKLFIYLLLAYLIYKMIRMGIVIHKTAKVMRESQNSQRGNRQEKDISAQSRIVEEKWLDEEDEKNR